MRASAGAPPSTINQLSAGIQIEMGDWQEITDQDLRFGFAVSYAPALSLT